MNNLFIKNLQEHFTRNKFLAIIYTVVMLISLGTLIGIISLYFGTANYPFLMFVSYFKFVSLLLLNILPVIFLIFFFYFLFNRVWLSFLVTSAIVIILTWVNYFKLSFRNDPLLIADLTLFFESLNMAGQYDVVLDWKMIVVIIVVLVGTIFSFFFIRMRISSWKIRLLSLIILLIIGGIGLPRFYLDEKLYYSIKNYGVANRWSQTEQFISRGFIYPFIYSFTTAKQEPPEGYVENEAEKILSNYEYSHIDEEKKVNIIAIMLEAYNDFSKFPEVDFKEDVYKVWRELKQESYSGQLVTNIFAGNTVNTERGFLTGFTELWNFRKPVPSYAYYFREQGYTVEGSHPSYDWFYNRKNINEYLGFERYYFFENYFEEKAEGEIAKDDILFSEIIKLYEENKKTGKPYFSFNVTYQNHGPYKSGVSYGEFIYKNDYSEETYNILNNYFGGIYQTNEQIKMLIEHFRKEDEPVVVVLFGDHNPWLGDNNSVYHELGINIDLSTEEGFYNYYNTPYIIWANDKAKDVLGKEIVGEGAMIGPYFLMNELFSVLGYEGNEFMKISNRLKEDIEVVHTNKRYIQFGELTNELTEESKQKLTEFLHAQYYWIKTFKR